MLVVGEEDRTQIMLVEIQQVLVDLVEVEMVKVMEQMVAMELPTLEVVVEEEVTYLPMAVLEVLVL